MAVVLVVSVEESQYDPNGKDGAHGKDGMPVQQRHPHPCPLLKSDFHFILTTGPPSQGRTPWHKCQERGKHFAPSSHSGW